METLGHVLVVVALIGAGISAGLWRATLRVAARVDQTLGPHVERRTGRLGRAGLGMGVEAVAGRISAPLLLWATVLTVLAGLLAVLAWDPGATPLAIGLGLTGALVAWVRVPRLLRKGHRRAGPR